MTRLGQCDSYMVLPPQHEGRMLRCEADADHDGLHTAIDPDGIVRRWPNEGPAWETASGDYAGLR